MSIRYNDNLKTITLSTKNTSYMMKIGNLNYLNHLYYGPVLEDDDLSYQIKEYDRGFSGNPYDSRFCRTFSLDAQPQEFSTQQQGDFRVDSIEVVNSDGSYSFDGRVKSWKITEGKYKLKNLPTAFAADADHVDSLEVILEDAFTKVQVSLLYSTFEEADVITRAVRVYNGGDQPIHLLKIMSMCLDFLNGRDLDILSLPGRYGQERQVERKALTHHVHTIQSVRGTSSHQQNPFVVLCDHEATEDYGDCYGTALMYSGNFLAEVELDQYDQVRMQMGINTRQFDFEIPAGESFDAPEALMVYSAEGLTKLSHIYHDFFRTNMCKSKFMNVERPILINTWEAAFFTFDEKKLLEIAIAAKKIGVDLLVMDDGWFGKRDDDNSGLGDWTVNEEKIHGGLNALVKKVNELDMKFGIWFEPEMVSEDSDLFRTHPDWVMQIPGRPALRSRNQLALDLTREDVQDYMIAAVNKILDSANIYYMKWDLNRSLNDIWSNAMPAHKQGEVYHRYVLGLYRVMDGIIRTHPDILFEGCSGGGGRFDPAMLAYFPQYWVSDNTRPIDSLQLHYGTSFCYPVSSQGAHVSESGPRVSWKTRACVAMGGTFGYETDATKMEEEEIAECLEQSKLFRKYYPVIFYGDYYRLSNPFEPNILIAWQSVSKDKTKSLVSVVTLKETVNGAQEYVKVKGLDPKKKYHVSELDIVLSGTALMKAGIPIPREVPEYSSFQYYLEEV